MASIERENVALAHNKWIRTGPFVDYAVLICASRKFNPQIKLTCNGFLISGLRTSAPDGKVAS